MPSGIPGSGFASDRKAWRVANKEALNAAALRRYHDVIKKDPEKYAAKREADRKAQRSPARKAWREKNKEELNAYHRDYHKKRKAADPQYKRENIWAARSRQYGITKNEYLALLTSQNGACKICGEIHGEALRVDHNHTTGKIRGLLCDRCNVGLGNFKDDPERLKAAAAYLIEAVT